MDSAAKLQKRFLLLGHTFSASLLTCKKKNEKHRFFEQCTSFFPVSLSLSLSLSFPLASSLSSRYRYRYRYRYRFLWLPLSIPSFTLKAHFHPFPIRFHDTSDNVHSNLTLFCNRVKQLLLLFLGIQHNHIVLHLGKRHVF